MHGHGAEFLEQMSGFLGGYYLTLAMMNGLVAYYLWHFKHRNVAALGWTAFAGVMVICSPLAMSGSPPSIPVGIKDAINAATGPVVYSVGTTALLALLFAFRRFFVQPIIAWILLNVVLVTMGLAMADPNFASIVTKPDNVPIVGLIYLLGFFTWLATAKAVENDDRIAQGLEPMEKLGNEKVLVWPDLVYTELICMIAITALLLVWGIALQAPLEEPASRVKTPNPSKAPWYFLGLQEMLVYYDPWMAGVVLPSMIIVGLMAIPYLDFNKQGNGYYTINQRKFSYLIFQFGFLELWVTLIILGTFFRGPNWNIFGPFEFWDPHKVLALNNVDLSQYFWTYGLDQGLPKAPPGSGLAWNLFYIFKREWLGIVLVLGYFMALPPLMATTIFRRFFVRMGFVRFMLLANLFLFMAALPIKMVLRWVFNLKYIIAIPEYFLNF
jgi:Cytochrome b(C-terminal)/b6/petD